VAPGPDGHAHAHTALAADWLTRHQDQDGHWDGAGFMKHDPEDDRCTGAGVATHDVGLTALALLSFLGDGSTMRTGPHREVVKKAVAWLVAQQEASGRFGKGAPGDFIFDHAIATWAICEAFGLSDYQRLRVPAQRGIDYLERHRDARGVWGYMPRGADGNTAVTGWCMLAYRSAKGFELTVAEAAFTRTAAWLDAVTDADGRAGYGKLGEVGSPRRVVRGSFPPEHVEAMTGVALLTRFLLGQDPEANALMAKSVRVVSAKPPRWDEEKGTIDLYAWLFGSLALYHAGGKEWSDWSLAVSVVVAKQRKDGAHAGSWDPERDAWGTTYGRVYTTALAILIMETYYRYTRLVR
jgi:hypothetical protein